LVASQPPAAATRMAIIAHRVSWPAAERSTPITDPPVSCGGGPRRRGSPSQRGFDVHAQRTSSSSRYSRGVSRLTPFGRSRPGQTLIDCGVFDFSSPRTVTQISSPSRLNRPAQLLIADFGPTRLGVRMALNDQEVEICAEAGGAAQAIAAAKLAQPDICFVGSDLPGGGIAAVRGIGEVAPDAVIIVAAGAETASELLMALRAGAIGYVPGTITPEQLRRVFHAALAGEAIVPRSMTRYLIRELHTSAALVIGQVTSRQAQVVDLLRHGQSPADIARRLDISPVTVRRHISDALRKLGLKDRRALMRFEGGMAGNGGASPGLGHT